MTSEFTLNPTQKFFEEHNFFGMDRADVVMFEQRMLPAVGFDGKAILERKDKVAMAPGKSLKGQLLSVLYRPSCPLAGLYVTLVSLQTVTAACTEPWPTTKSWKTWRREASPSSTSTVWTIFW